MTPEERQMLFSLQMMVMAIVWSMGITKETLQQVADELKSKEDKHGTESHKAV